MSAMRPTGPISPEISGLKRSKSLYVWAVTLLVAMPLASGQETALRVVRVAEGAVLIDPNAGFWEKAPGVSIPLLPQVVTTPRHPDPAVKELGHSGAQWPVDRLSDGMAGSHQERPDHGG